MAETSPPTSEPGRWTSPKRLALIGGGVALAVVLLVVVVRSGGNDAADDTASTATSDGIASADGDDGSDDADSSAPDPESDDADSTDGDAAGGSSAPDDDSTTDAPESSVATEGSGATGSSEAASATTTTIVANLPQTTTAGAPPPTTTAAAAPTTNAAIAPPSTITVTLPPSLTVPTPSVTDECAVLGEDSFGDVTVELTLVSPTTSIGSLTVGFTLNDAGGGEIVADAIVVDFMAPGEVARLAVETFEPVPAGSDVSRLSCVIESIEVGELLEYQVPAGPDDTCSVIGVDDVGDLQLATAVRNPSAVDADVAFTYAVRDPEGTRVMSDIGFADGLAPGEVATQEVDTLLAPPPAIDVASLTCDIVGHEVF